MKTNLFILVIITLLTPLALTAATPNCVCTIDNKPNQTPPSGITFKNNDCTQPQVLDPLTNQYNKPLNYSCKAVSQATIPNCTCTQNGKAIQPQTAGVTFTNNDCTQPQVNKNFLGLFNVSVPGSSSGIVCKTAAAQSSGIPGLPGGI